MGGFKVSRVSSVGPRLVVIITLSPTLEPYVCEYYIPEDTINAQEAITSNTNSLIFDNETRSNSDCIKKLISRDDF